VKNEEILYGVKEERKILCATKRRKAKLFFISGVGAAF
jgi:hypothetical protein